MASAAYHRAVTRVIGPSVAQRLATNTGMRNLVVNSARGTTRGLASSTSAAGTSGGFATPMRSAMLGRAMTRPMASPLGWPPIARRAVHARAISFRFSAVPKAAFKVLRLPAYAGAAGAGALAYGNYKVDEFKGVLGNAYGKAKDAASDAFGRLSDATNDARSRAAEGWDSLTAAVDSIELPQVPEGVLSFFKSLGGSAKGAHKSAGEDSSSSSEGSGGGGGGSGKPEGAAAALAASIFGTASSNDDKAALVDESEEAPKNTSEQLMHLTRQLIEVRNILKSIDHDSDELTLPSIVVIGSQSSGKSSVLEAIVGHEFLPKGSNMVTRRPIELTLIHTPATGGKGSVVEYGEFPGTGMGKVKDFKQIQKTLFDMNMAVPEKECVSDTPIELRIYSPHVPDLTMIDLPGYVQLSSMDQPEELREKIEHLCEKYIKPPNVILAVCAADVDLANSPALRASRKVDPLGLRTIGVVTKMDLVPPEQGSAILRNNNYPLALGYVGVVCKNNSSMFSARHDGGGEGRISSAVMRQEADFFEANKEHFAAPARGRYAGVEPLLGTDQLRRRLMAVLEESMGSNLHGIANAVQLELEEASYQFKVQYNDRQITAESYVAETMDTLKLRFKEFASNFGKSEVRALLKQSLDDKVMDILAQVYWSDKRTPELSKLAEDRKLTPEQLDKYWQYKLDASTSALTKSGIGRTSTQLVVDAIRTQIEHLAVSEPFNFHPDTAERIMGFSTAILRDRFGLTADQVENSVKPLKYEVEVEPREWESGRQNSVELVTRELKMCDDAADRINKAIGKKRLRGAMQYLEEIDERERRRAAARIKALKEANANADANSVPVVKPLDEEDPLRPDYNSALLSRAREALFLQNRADILRLRLKALQARRCKAGPDNKAFCPEAFLNIVADKLTYTAVMFINIELLAEFFYQFPRELDSRLVYDMEKRELAAFARENPSVKRHLDLQERKEKLELVMNKLDTLVKLYQEKQAPKREASGKWSLF